LPPEAKAQWRKGDVTTIATRWRCSLQVRLRNQHRAMANGLERTQRRRISRPHPAGRYSEEGTPEMQDSGVGNSRSTRATSGDMTTRILEASDLRTVNTMASAAKVRSKKLAANKDRLNRLLAELEELCVGSADVYEIEEQISMPEEIYRASDALQAELELDLEGEER
ncbi:hypothetical protein T11_8724, partial [Trichinella zimbabwensis]